jgi:hypothetical protein
MEVNDSLRKQIFAIIENQLKDNNPPETKETYNRLQKLGYDNVESKKMIGQCVAVEIFQILKDKKPFNEKRFVKNLKALPEEPFE